MAPSLRPEPVATPLRGGRAALEAKFAAHGNRACDDCRGGGACKDPATAPAAKRIRSWPVTRRSPMSCCATSVFGPKGAASVELCVRDLVRNSRYARSTLVVCPKVEEPFDGIAIETVPDAACRRGISPKPGASERMLRQARGRHRDRREPSAGRRDYRIGRSPAGDPAQPRLREGGRGPGQADRPRRATPPHFRDSPSSARTAPTGFWRTSRSARGPMRAVPNGLDMAAWSDAGPKEKTILSVGRALDDKGHLEAMAAIVRLLPSRPDWRARFILSATDREPKTVQALREAAARLEGRVTIDDGPALRRGQGGLGEGRRRDGVDEDARTLRPHGARSSGERRRACSPPGSAVSPKSAVRTPRSPIRPIPRALPSGSPPSWIRPIFARNSRAPAAPVSPRSTTSARSRSGWTISSTKCWRGAPASKTLTHRRQRHGRDTPINSGSPSIRHAPVVSR